jgi:hypothetical protein
MASIDGLAFLVGLSMAAVAAYWVYKDAKSKNVHDPGGWAVLTLLGFIIFLPVYLLWGRKRVNHTELQTIATPGGKRFCAQCGAQLPVDVRFCTNCGREI